MTVVAGHSRRFDHVRTLSAELLDSGPPAQPVRALRWPPDQIIQRIIDGTISDNSPARAPQHPPRVLRRARDLPDREASAPNAIGEPVELLRSQGEPRGAKDGPY